MSTSVIVLSLFTILLIICLRSYYCTTYLLYD
ncbi:hypothetical protein E5N71_09410 [Candidatus Nitrosocosmicus sp. SS]|nr:hypothetical protein F1Z66_03380 [Candidatus Nitrosocosmicus sp. SS]KAF0868590.1 hypothetical protein E5N71_09410 [Candidatus Nitrosocosmicus sp. SS]